MSVSGEPSHPTWVRGLKLVLLVFMLPIQHVAPYVGAWIETQNATNKANLKLSHPTWVRGLKHHLQNALCDFQGRTLRGCVD